MWGVGGKGQGSSLQEEASHTYTLRLRLNWLQTDSENDFPENGVFGCYFKFDQTEKHFQLTENESQNNGKSFSFPFSLQMISGLGK